jgi:hypothetical protein
MQIRGLTLEQIEQAVEEASAEYGGNLELSSFYASVPMAEPKTTTTTYTVAAQWRVIQRQLDPDTGEVEFERDTGFTPYIYGHLSEEGRNIAHRRQCEDRAGEYRRDALEVPDALSNENSFFVVRWIEEHERTFEDTQTHTYESVTGLPLNKRGDGWRVKFRVKSSRRPGARVGSGRFGAPRRIASACWHAHREIFRAMFRINPDTKIKTALYYYRGEEDFERNFEGTRYGHGVVNAAPVECIGDLCNCDEGDYPEYAVEGLTPEQWQLRFGTWECYGEPGCHIKMPKYNSAVLPEYREEGAA